MNSILIESNRVIADAQLKANQSKSLSQTSIEHSQANSNANWSTTIDSGIQLQPGDQITMEACALNINGAGSGDFQQFNGSVDVPEKSGEFRKDNAVEFEIAYYTTNNIEFNFPLPSGKHVVEMNPTFGGTYGSPSMNGRHLWRPHYGAEYNSATITALLDQPNEQKTIIEPKANWNGERLYIQDRGGYYWLGMNLDVGVPLSDGTLGPGQPPTTQPLYSNGLANGAAYINWCSQTCWLSAPGVQFGQSKGPTLPNVNAPFYDPLEADQTASTLNMNVDVKNQYTNSGYFPNGLNGGANPLLILNGVAALNPRLEAYLTPPGQLTTGTLCGSFGEWDLLGPQFYQYQPHEDTPTYKGSYHNDNPSQNKLYQPKKDDVKDYCRGPYYDCQNNYLNKDGATGDPDMGGLVNYNKKNTTIENQNERNDYYWKLQTKKIKIQLQTGNIAPTRISEIITETFKARGGNADYPTEEFFKQRVWDTLTYEERTSTPSSFSERLVGGISSSVYATFPTLQGSCLEKANTIKTSVPANENGWDMLNEDNSAPSTLEPSLSLIGADSVGTNANEIQMKNQYWSNQLCGNPFEWSCVTKLLPMAQYNPFIMSNTTIAGFDPQTYSIYTGITNITNPNFPLNHSRVKADGTLLNVSIGEFGDMPCLLETPKKGISTEVDQAYDGLYYCSEVTAANAGIPVQAPFKINSRPVGLWITTSNQKKYDTIATPELEIVLTNMIFNGQLRNDLLNESASLIEGHLETATGTDTLASQSNEFFNNTYVKWTIGRLNDQQTFPEQYINDYFAKEQKNIGTKGLANYLPNIYQSNLLLNNDPMNGWDTTQPRGDINSILSYSSQTLAPSPVIQGTYRLQGMKMGIYNSANTPAYSFAENPQSLYNNNPASGPIGFPYDTDQFGPPCYTCFKGEFTRDIEQTNGFKKICDRHIKAYRYLPQGSFTNPITNIEYQYTPIDAWNGNIHTGLDILKWTTRPAEMSYPNFEKLWNTITSLNNGKGCGWIPIFSNDPANSNIFNSIPFLGIINIKPAYKDMPLPAKGEFIFLGSSPSLTQNDLHLPATSQQIFQTEYKPGYVGMCPIDNPATEPTDKTIVEFKDNMRSSSWATSKYSGSNDPIWVFDNTFNRYTYSKFHTNYFKGNGVFPYGSVDGVSDPDTKEIAISATPATFSKQLTLPNGYIGFLSFAGPGDKQNLQYAELIEGNIIWDYTNPGGNYAGGVPSVVDNQQYGSPAYGTQYEMKLMGSPGTQIDITASFPGNPNTGTIIGPKQDLLFEDFIVPSSVRPYPYVEAVKVPYPTISARSGIGIIGLEVPTNMGNTIVLSNSDYARYEGTLLDKMGFSLNQFLPLYGKVQTELNHTLFNKFSGPNAPAGLAYHNLCYPITTQAQISSSLTPALCNGFGISKQDIPVTAPVDLAMPFYNLGMLIPKGTTTGQSESMFAISLPTKNTFPYLVCRSNIMTPTALQYIGGPNGQQLLPAISYLMTNYATNDYFYNNRSDLVFVVNRPYVLTEIRTSIHLPNGQLANTLLDSNSAVIYRIDFAKQTAKQSAEEKELADNLFTSVSGVKKN
tara:strand:- start:875 stop:5572 length:4698 start_codon:yes stop_codon:yes gene_type:complete